MAINLKNIKIELLNKNDFKTLITWAESEKDLIQWCGPVFNFPLTEQQLEIWFNESVKFPPKRMIFKAVNDTGEITGMGEIGVIDRNQDTASICRIFVDKKFRGNGIAVVMISFIISYAFKVLNLKSLELNVYSFNTPAIKCYERLGFHRTDVKSKTTAVGNEIWKGYTYKLLKENWADNEKSFIEKQEK